MKKPVMKYYKFFIILSTFLFISSCGSQENIFYLSDKWEYSIPDNPTEEVPSKAFRSIQRAGDFSEYLKSKKGTIWLRNEFPSQTLIGKKLQSLYLGRISYIDEVSINTVRIGYTGKFTEKPWSFGNQSRVYQIPSGILKENESNQLLIKIFFDSEGYILDKPFIGETEFVEAYVQKGSLIPRTLVFSIICFLIMAVIISSTRLVIYKTDQTIALLLGATVLSVLVLSDNFSDLFSWLPVQYNTFKKIIMIAALVSGILLLLYLKNAYSNLKSSSFTVLLSLTSFVGLALILLLPGNPLVWNKAYLSPIFSTFFLASSFILLRTEIQEKNQDALLILACTLFFWITILIDWILYISYNRFHFDYSPPVGGLNLIILHIQSMKKSWESVHINEANSKRLVEAIKEEQEKTALKENEIQSILHSQNEETGKIALILNRFQLNRVSSEEIYHDTYIEQLQEVSVESGQIGLGGDICILEEIQLASQNDHYIFLFSGDVGGKSILSATLAIHTAATVIGVKTKIINDANISTPENFLREMSNTLSNTLKTMNEQNSVSCLLGALNIETGIFTYSNFGHPEVILFRNKQCVTIFNNSKDSKIGGEVSTDTPINEINLIPGDMIFVGSNGIQKIEQKGNPGNLLNSENVFFCELIEANNGSLSQSIVELKKHGVRKDDISMIQLGYKLPKEINQQQTILENSEIVYPENMDINEITIVESETENTSTLDDKDSTKENSEELTSQENVEEVRYNVAPIQDFGEETGTIDSDRTLEIYNYAKYYYDHKEFSEAARYFEEYLEQNDNSADGWFYLSVAFKHLRLFNRAIDAAERCDEIEPGRLSNLINLADNYRYVGELDKARILTNRILAISSDNDLAQKLDKFLKSKGV